MYIKPILRALELSNYEILEDDLDGFIVARHFDDIIISEPQVIEGPIVEHVEVKRQRFEYELAACKFLMSNDVVECCIMFGIAQMFVLSSDRGILRHVINWPNNDDIKCSWNIIETEGGE